jgi:hypothetical protein
VLARYSQWGLAMERLLTAEFWQDVIARAPWVIPSLLIGGLIGWRWKGINDSGEIRGLRERLAFAHEQYEAIVRQLNELRDKVAQQERVIATAVAPVRVDLLVSSNTEIKNVVTSLSTSTSTLGEALNFIPGSARSTLTASPPSVENPS